VERKKLPSLSDMLRKSKKTGKDPQVRAVSGRTYLKAMPLRDLSDLDAVRNEVRSGNILILRITPLANKSLEDVKRAVNELSTFAETIGGDIARLGEERVVMCPQNVKIWRGKSPMPNEPMPTAA
jgi:SepF-like predicted cell division protein (DUF552 family)